VVLDGDAIQLEADIDGAGRVRAIDAAGLDVLLI
jgi:hypothetical protein